MQRLISGALSYSITAYQLDFLYLVFTVDFIAASARDSGNGKCLRGQKPKTFLFFALRT
jgi:hypothetical protein